VTPNWQQSHGGNLELWDSGLKAPCRTIVSQFNRLVIMETVKKSWHSVNKVLHEGVRCCVSNYFFTPGSLERENYFHVTSFRGRPEQKVVDLILRLDIRIRNMIRKVFKHGIVKTKHIYSK